MPQRQRRVRETRLRVRETWDGVLEEFGLVLCERKNLL